MDRQTPSESSVKLDGAKPDNADPKPRSMRKASPSVHELYCTVSGNIIIGGIKSSLDEGAGAGWNCALGMGSKLVSSSPYLKACQHNLEN